MPRTYQQVTENPASVIAGEAAVVTPDDTRLHLLNAVGTWVWEQCLTPQTLDGLVAGACARYAVSPELATAQIAAFLDQGVQTGLLKADNAG